MVRGLGGRARARRRSTADLKPSNIRLTADGLAEAAGLRARADGGRARGTRRRRRPRAGRWRGRRPTCLRSRCVARRRTSGRMCTGRVRSCYQMATGGRPFGDLKSAELVAAILKEKPRSPREVNPEISSSLEGVIEKATDKEPGLRYQTAKELLVDLERLAAGQSGRAGGKTLPSGPLRSPSGDERGVRSPWPRHWRWPCPPRLGCSARASRGSPRSRTLSQRPFPLAGIATDGENVLLRRRARTHRRPDRAAAVWRRGARVADAVEGSRQPAGPRFPEIAALRARAQDARRPRAWASSAALSPAKRHAEPCRRPDTRQERTPVEQGGSPGVRPDAGCRRPGRHVCGRPRWLAAAPHRRRADAFSSRRLGSRGRADQLPHDFTVGRLLGGPRGRCRAGAAGRDPARDIRRFDGMEPRRKLSAARKRPCPAGPSRAAAVLDATAAARRAFGTRGHSARCASLRTGAGSSPFAQQTATHDRPIRRTNGRVLGAARPRSSPASWPTLPTAAGWPGWPAKGSPGA